MLLLCSLKREREGQICSVTDRSASHQLFFFFFFCSRKRLEVKLPDVVSQSGGRRKEKRKKIQLLSGFCSFEGRGFPLQTLLSALNTAHSKGIPEGRGQGWLLESDLIDDADLNVAFLLYGKLVKRDRLSHVYKI